MIATALGRRSNNIRDVRRTFRQSLWLIATVTPPVWLILWYAEPIIVALGQDRGLAEGAAIFLRGYMWSMLPFLAFQAMRNFVSALERPGWVLVISLAGIVLNAVLGWALIFGHFGFPAMGLFGGGLASSIVWTLLMVALAVVIMTDRQFRRFHLFGRWWRPDWPRYRRMWLLGLPIGLAMGFEGGVFSAAAYLMGLISADAVAAHAVALQIAALSFMVPWGMAQAATVRVGLALGRGDRAGIARAGLERVGHGHRLHGAHGARHLAHPAAADDPVPRRRCRQRQGHRARRVVPRRRRDLPDRRRRAGRRRGHPARAPRHARADDLHLHRLLADRDRGRRVAGVQRGLGRGRDLDRARARARHRRGR